MRAAPRNVCSASSAVAAPNSNNAAMNLWQKFSDMQRSIDEARKERDTLQQDLEACQEKQKILQQNRREERKRKRQADEHAMTFDEKVSDLQHEYQTVVQPAYTEASLVKENTLLQRSRWNEYKATLHQAFLEESREFRTTCKQLRMTATMAGLNYAPIQAAVYAKSGGDEEECDVYDGLDDVVTVTTEEELGSSSSMANPSSWTMSPDDDEFQNLFVAYSSKKSEYEEAWQELENRKRCKQDKMDKESSRFQQMETLQKQLDRIARDNSKLESQIQDLKALTEVAKCTSAEISEAMSSHRANGPSSRQPSSSVTPSPRPRNTTARGSTNLQAVARNPYARTRTSNTKTSGSTTTSTTATSRLSANQRRSELRAVVLGKQSSIFHGVLSAEQRPRQQQQHQPQESYRPRFRRDKQFGSSLEISGGHDEDNEFYHADVGTGSNITNQASGEADMAAGNQGGLASSNKVGDDHSNTDMVQLFDSDDDDEDILLSYSAFSK